MHLAVGAVVNAFWDLWAKEASKPVWRLVADMTPEQIVDIVDFRYLTDAITREEALAILRKAEAGKAARIATLEREGYACYTTSAGWLGYDDDKLRRLCKEAIDAGFNHVKMKVGRDLADDIRRLTIAREVIGPDRYLMIDANQVWEVGQAIDWLKELVFAKPFFIEEPTNPDDVAGHKKIRQAVAPMKVATGEMCQNRIMFKQFIAEARSTSCRSFLPHGRAERVLSVLLLAAVQPAGLAACRGRGLVRICAAFVDDRLCRRVGHQGRQGDRVCRPSPRAIGALCHRQCGLYAAKGAGLLHRDEAGLNCGQHVPRMMV